MTTTFSQGVDGTIGFAQFFELIINGLSSSVATTANSTTFTAQTSYGSITLTGSGFTYTTIGGQTYLTDGTIDTLGTRHFNGYSLGESTGLNLSAAALSSALLNELFGFDPLALEDLFLTKDWTINGDDRAQVLTDAQVTGDGAPYAPSGDDIAYLLGGDDIYALGAGNDTMFGGNGNDSLYGGSGTDTLNGEADNDHLFGGDDADFLFGGNGDDYLYGDAGNDVLTGGSQRDRLYGGDDDDALYGGKNADFLYGGAGNDVIYGGTSSDIVVGGSGNDTMYGEGKKDKLYGQDGNDTIFGGASTDRLFGQNNDDVLYGGASNDRLYGGTGDDTLIGGNGNDLLYGGTGADEFIFDNQSGNDQMFGYDANADSITISDTAFLSIGIFTDKITVTHTGGTVTINNFSVSNLAEYNAFIASIDADFTIA